MRQLKFANDIQFDLESMNQANKWEWEHHTRLNLLEYLFVNRNL